MSSSFDHPTLHPKHYIYLTANAQTVFQVVHVVLRHCGQLPQMFHQLSFRFSELDDAAQTASQRLIACIKQKTTEEDLRTILEEIPCQPSGNATGNEQRFVIPVVTSTFCDVFSKWRR